VGWGGAECGGREDGVGWWARWWGLLGEGGHLLLRAHSACLRVCPPPCHPPSPTLQVVRDTQIDCALAELYHRGKNTERSVAAVQQAEALQSVFMRLNEMEDHLTLVQQVRGRGRGCCCCCREEGGGGGEGRPGRRGGAPADTGAPACLPTRVLRLQGAAKHVELRQDQHTLKNNDLNYIRQVWGKRVYSCCEGPACRAGHCSAAQWSGGGSAMGQRVVRTVFCCRRSHSTRLPPAPRLLSHLAPPAGPRLRW
jgi:hypothetical protein